MDGPIGVSPVTVKKIVGLTHVEFVAKKGNNDIDSVGHKKRAKPPAPAVGLEPTT